MSRDKLRYTFVIALIFTLLAPGGSHAFIGENVLPLKAIRHAKEFEETLDILLNEELDYALETSRQAIELAQNGRHVEAIPLAEEALSIFEKLLNSDHPYIETSLNNLAFLYHSIGRYEEAESLYQRALDINERGFDQLGTALNLLNLAFLYQEMGRFSDSESLTQRVVRIREQQLGPDHPLVASSLNNLALLYTSMGRYAEAEELYLRALEIGESSLEPNSPYLARGLNNLANLYARLGRDEEAAPLHLNALRIAEEISGPNHPDTALSITGVASFNRSIGNFEEAESLYRRAVNIYEQRLGENHPYTAIALNGLASVYASMTRFEEAEFTHMRALNIYEQQLGENHPYTANGLSSLASVYDSTRRFGEAESFYKRALDIYRQQLGDEHPATADALTDLAGLYHFQGDFSTALRYLQQGLQSEEAVFSRNLIGGSDADKYDYLATITGTTSGIVSLHLNNLPHSKEAAQTAVATILQRKGRILDIFTDLRTKLGSDPDFLTLLNELNAASSRLSNLVYFPPIDLTEQTYNTQINTLQSKIRDLEDQLSRSSKNFAAITDSPTLEDVQIQLPHKSALVELILYQPFIVEGELEEEQQSDLRYAAYVVQANGSVQGFDLGSAEIIDQAVDALLTGLTSPSTPLGQLRADAQTLEALIIAPLKQTLGETNTIFFAPDGSLNLIPFEVLVDESGDYLIETYKFRYLTSGRDLMRLEETVTESNPALLLGNPTYGRPGEQIAQAETRSIDFENRIFPPLPGTQDEVDLIAPKLSSANVYTQTNATEAAIKQQDSPNILHVATHGFFEPNEDALNPLLQSGLVLAGAAAGGQSGPDQDGILTALEVTGMNLQGTQLVVLSACETGLGELAVGEGIYGLRRAFVLAGSQTQVISLWKVDDTATQELMVDYYDRLLAGTPRDAALRDTQLAFLESEDYSHPYYWAAFIGSGDWRPLQQ